MAQNSLCCSVGWGRGPTCGHAAPVAGRVYTGSYRPSCNAKVCWCAPGGPAQPGHLTVLSHHTIPHPPGPKSSSTGLLSQDNGKKQLWGCKMLDKLSCAFFPLGCAKRAAETQPGPQGLSWVCSGRKHLLNLIKSEKSASVSLSVMSNSATPWTVASVHGILQVRILE